MAAKKDDTEKDKASEHAAEEAEEVNEAGLRGAEVDTTPNENYTVEGVTSGADVPESAEDPVAARREATSDDVGRPN